MSPNLWFTEADLAEVDVVARVLVDGIWTHREKCATCREKGRYCAPVVEAIAEAVGWTERRRLTSRATELRTRELVRIRELARGNGRAS